MLKFNGKLQKESAVPFRTCPEPRNGETGFGEGGKSDGRGGERGEQEATDPNYRPFTPVPRERTKEAQTSPQPSSNMNLHCNGSCNGDLIYGKPSSQSLCGESSQVDNTARVSGMLFDERAQQRKELGKAEKGERPGTTQVS